MMPTSPLASEANKKSDLLSRAVQYLSGRVDSDAKVAPNASGFAFNESSRIRRTRSQSLGPTGSI